jgi:hypothetical protein
VVGSQSQSRVETQTYTESEQPTLTSSSQDTVNMNTQCQRDDEDDEEDDVIVDTEVEDDGADGDDDEVQILSVTTHGVQQPGSKGASSVSSSSSSKKAVATTSSGGKKQMVESSSAVAVTATTSARKSSSVAGASSSSSSSASAMVAVATQAVVPAAGARVRRCVFKQTKNPDPGQCLHLINEMYDFYYAQEEAYTVRPYMHRQEDINAKMRSILVDWLVEVHYKFKLQPPTLWLCVNILDRYLSRVVISRAKLQLVGVSALFIACKFEEIYPPEIKDCIYITDYAYKKEELVAMEAAILLEIDYQVFVPTGYHFLDRFLNSIAASARTRNLACYYAERFLQEPEYLDVLPHKIACAAVYCSLRQQHTQLPASRPFADKALSLPCWGPILQQESGVREDEIIPLATIMMNKVSGLFSHDFELEKQCVIFYS